MTRTDTARLEAVQRVVFYAKNDLHAARINLENEVARQGPLPTVQGGLTLNHLRTHVRLLEIAVEEAEKLYREEVRRGQLRAMRSNFDRAIRDGMAHEKRLGLKGDSDLQD